MLPTCETLLTPRGSDVLEKGRLIKEERNTRAAEKHMHRKAMRRLQEGETVRMQPVRLEGCIGKKQ